MELICGDSLDAMRAMPARSIDAVVTDPPYGISFKDEEWDRSVPPEPYWREALRVCKPGGHLLCFGYARAFHRVTLEVERAGWEVRDCLMWVYGSGFARSMDVGRAVGRALASDSGLAAAHGPGAAGAWRGWGTSLKPAWDPIVMARRPLEGTVARNALAHGTGAIDVDACRVPFAGPGDAPGRGSGKAARSGLGRHPANLVHDGSGEVVALLPGGAARFFYCARARGEEREGNPHPTAKPVALMEWLVKMVTREGQVVLDPFMGSGTTGVACARLGRGFVGVEREPEYFETAERRCGTVAGFPALE